MIKDTHCIYSKENRKALNILIYLVNIYLCVYIVDECIYTYLYKNKLKEEEQKNCRQMIQKRRNLYIRKDEVEIKKK